MPHTRSAKKNLRKTEKRRLHNRAIKKAIKTQIKAGELDAAALPEQALTLTFPVRGASVNYIRGLTLLTRADGTATPFSSLTEMTNF